MPYKDPAKAKAAAHDRYVRSRERCLARSKRWADEHPEERRKLSRESRTRARAKDPEKVRKYNKSWRKNNLERARVREKAYRERTLERERSQHRKRLYGLTPEQYDEMLAAQGGKCAICRSEFDGTPHVDHDHATGKVRGLLCNGCNRCLGFANDNQQTLERAAAYLRR